VKVAKGREGDQTQGIAEVLSINGDIVRDAAQPSVFEIHKREYTRTSAGWP